MDTVFCKGQRGAAYSGFEGCDEDGTTLGRRLRDVADKLCDGLVGIFKKKQLPTIVQRVGPMFQLMFTGQPAIRDYREFSQFVDRVAFQKFVLSLFPLGVYASPSAALHSIVTLAHTDEDVDMTLEAAAKALGASGQ